MISFTTIPRENIGSHAYVDMIHYKDFWGKIPEADKNIIFLKNQQNIFLICFKGIYMENKKVETI